MEDVENGRRRRSSRKKKKNAALACRSLGAHGGAVTVVNVVCGLLSAENFASSQATCHEVLMFTALVRAGDCVAPGDWRP